MNKKWIIFSLVFIFIIVLTIILLNKWHYPSLPIESVSPKEAIQKLNKSDEMLVEIAKEDDATWYIINNSEDVNENIKQYISKDGWTFKEFDGNSLFFEKNDETLIVSTQMWTSKYRLIKVPAK